MKIALLASDPDLYSHKRIIEAAEKRGHEVLFIDIKQCYINITASNPLVHFRGGEVVPHIDAIIPRIRPAITFYGTAILRQFEMTEKVYSLNSSTSILRSRDKLRSLQLLSNKGINMPITGFAHSPLDTKALIRMVGGAPLIVKLLESTHGVGVVLAETNKAAESVINAFKSLKANFLVQEYIKEAEGRDIRCLVLNKKVIASMQRQAQEGHFKANLHQGGRSEKVKITTEERNMAIQAVEAMGLEFGGVDFIRSKTGPKILEINSSPGIEGIERTTGLDLATPIIKHLEDNYKNPKAKKRSLTTA